MQTHPKSYCIHEKQSGRASTRLFFANVDGTTATWRFLCSNLCIELFRQYRQFQPCKPIREAATSHAKQKRYSFHPYRLMFIFCKRRRHDCHMAFSLLESVHRIAPPASSLFGKLLHPRKAKRYSFHPYRLMFIFCQRRRHDCRKAFSLLESVHRIAPPASSLFGKLLHPRKAKRYSFHPYRLMFIFCQHRRHDCHMAFSLPESVHRIAPPMRTHGR